MKRYYCLAPVLGEPGAPRYPVDRSEQLIGRSEKADISLLEPTISRRHASVRLDGERVKLVDLGSKHGTFVNSRRVTSTELRDGDIVVFGLSLVLRLESSNKPIRRPEAQLSHGDSPTLVEPVDNLEATAVRPTPKRTDTGVNVRLPAGTSSRRQPRDVAGACASYLPETYVRLSELRMSLKRLVEYGVDETDPYPILASVESVLTLVQKLMHATGTDDAPTFRQLDLARLVDRVVERVAPAFSARRIRFLTNVSPNFSVRGDARRLEGILSILLRSAARASPDGSPVEIIATEEKDGIRLAISHLGTEYPPDILELCRDRKVSDPLLREMGEVQRLTALIGGYLTMETKSGIGSTVRLVLPEAGGFAAP